MTDDARHTRNAERLTTCFPAFRHRLAQVLSDLEGEGYRPRIQDSYRSPADQIAAFQRGTSKLRFGFHNVTGPDGRPEALAADVLDDDAPLTPSREYLIRLAHLARAHRLTTGIGWGLPAKLRKAVDEAVLCGDTSGSDALHLGWDPTHVEPIGLTVTAAKRGARPS